MIGLDAADWARLPKTEQSERLKNAEVVLRSAGADFVVEDLPACDHASGRSKSLEGGFARSQPA